MKAVMLTGGMMVDDVFLPSAVAGRSTYAGSSREKLWTYCEESAELTGLVSQRFDTPWFTVKACSHQLSSCKTVLALGSCLMPWIALLSYRNMWQKTCGYVKILGVTFWLEVIHLKIREANICSSSAKIQFPANLVSLLKIFKHLVLHVREAPNLSLLPQLSSLLS